MKKKNIIAIILVLLVILLGGASVYVAIQLSTRKAVAPTAPTSKPKASEVCGANLICSVTQVTGASSCTDAAHPNGWWCCPINQTITNGVCVELQWVGSTACTATGSATVAACVPTGVKTCDPDCPTACGTAASTITTCTDSCGEATTKACAATAACTETVLEGSKTAYKNETANTPGRYTLTSELETVAKSQIYVYAVELTNTGEATASGVVIKDLLADMTVTFMDAVSGCSFNATNKELTCNTTINPDETKKLSFRVKANDTIVNGNVITNTARVTYPGGDGFDVTKDLTVSTVVGCNHTCTTDEECSTGLACDATTSKCRKAACLTEDDCTCTIVTPTATRVPATPTATRTITPTEEIVTEATPTILPETGIFDLPGIAAFGGGLLLAVVGILLAL